MLDILGLFRYRTSVAMVGIGLALASSRASILYDNSAQYLGLVHSQTGIEFGDEVQLKGKNPTLTQFQFQYHLDGGPEGPTGLEHGQVFFRLNDGPAVGGNPSPGTLMWNSTPFHLYDGFRTVTISGGTLETPRDFTWTVLFTGLRPDERASLLFYNPPTVGSSQNYFWEQSPDGGWSPLLLNDGAQPANFAARFEGTSTTPPTPIMRVGKPKDHQLKLSWSNRFSGYVVQEAPSPAGPWQTLDAAAKEVEGTFVLFVPIADGNHFYRIYQAPK